jgi:predicted TIM-barrel enzyme
VAVEDLDRVRAQVRCPVLAGSGATTDAVGELLRHADGVIVASSLLRRGRVDRALASAFVRASRGPSGAGRRR